MITNNPNTAAETASIVELSDAELDRASGGFTATDDLWVRGEKTKPTGANFGEMEIWPVKSTSMVTK